MRIADKIGQFTRSRWRRLYFRRIMHWTRSVRVASRSCASVARTSTGRAVVSRKLVLATGAALGATAIALAPPPLLLESTQPQRLGFAERAKARPPTVLRRAVEEAVEEEEAAEEAEEEEGQAGAYNEETGEINWDCPCLGGMADGPCGEEFKQAFSCFIYSEDEPKGINCVDKFKSMQDCFRKHPEVYAEEIEQDEATEAELDSVSQPSDVEKEALADSASSP